MKNAEKFRIGMWASVGFIVAASWKLYFSSMDTTHPMEPFVYTFFQIAQPLITLASTYLHFPFDLRWAVAGNAATYALLGYIVEGIRRPSRPIELSS